MTLDLSKYVKIKIKIPKDINSILNKSPRDMDVDDVIPVDNHLFDVKYDEEDITHEEQKLYRTFVSKPLLLCFRSMPVIQPAVEFMLTRLKNPKLDGYKKLSRVV